MQVNTRVLVKGVSQREGKTKAGLPVVYTNVDLYALEGRSLDIQASVDMANGGAALFEQAKKLQFHQVNAVLEISIFDRQARFNLVGLQPIKQ